MLGFGRRKRKDENEPVAGVGSQGSGFSVSAFNSNSSMLSVSSTSPGGVLSPGESGKRKGLGLGFKSWGGVGRNGDGGHGNGGVATQGSGVGRRGFLSRKAKGATEGGAQTYPGSTSMDDDALPDLDNASCLGVECALRFMETQGHVAEEGIYRVPGDKEEISRVAARIMAGPAALEAGLAGAMPNDLASGVKKVLRDRQPIVPYESFNAWAALPSGDILDDLLLALPLRRRHLFQALMRHVRVILDEPSNRMSPDALATCIGINVFRKSESPQDMVFSVADARRAFEHICDAPVLQQIIDFQSCDDRAVPPLPIDSHADDAKAVAHSPPVRPPPSPATAPMGMRAPPAKMSGAFPHSPAASAASSDPFGQFSWAESETPRSAAGPRTPGRGLQTTSYDSISGNTAAPKDAPPPPLLVPARSMHAPISPRGTRASSAAPSSQTTTPGGRRVASAAPTPVPDSARERSPSPSRGDARRPKPQIRLMTDSKEFPRETGSSPRYAAGSPDTGGSSLDRLVGLLKARPVVGAGHRRDPSRTRSRSGGSLGSLETFVFTQGNRGPGATASPSAPRRASTGGGPASAAKRIQSISSVFGRKAAPEQLAGSDVFQPRLSNEAHQPLAAEVAEEDRSPSRSPINPSLLSQSSCESVQLDDDYRFIDQNSGEDRGSAFSGAAPGMDGTFQSPGSPGSAASPGVLVAPPPLSARPKGHVPRRSMGAKDTSAQLTELNDEYKEARTRFVDGSGAGVLDTSAFASVGSDRSGMSGGSGTDPAGAADSFARMRVRGHRNSFVPGRGKKLTGEASAGGGGEGGEPEAP